MTDRPDDALLHAVFSGKEWREAADAMFEVAGAAIVVSLPSDGSALYASPRCAYCALIHPAEGVGMTGGWGCLGRTGEVGTGATTCFSGLPCQVAAVSYTGVQLAHLTVGGFVSTTRERKRMFERLLSLGVAEADACHAVRDIPVVPRRKAESLVTALRVHAESLIARAYESRGSADRMRELEVFLDAGREFLELGHGEDELEHRILARALLVVGAERGRLVLRRPGTDLADVVAVAGESDGLVEGDVLRLGEVVEGRVLASGNSVIVTGREGTEAGRAGRGETATVSIGLRRPEGCLGAFTIHGVVTHGPATREAMRLLERFATVAATVLENTRSDREARRSLREMVHLDAFARTLAACSTCDEVAEVAIPVLHHILDAGVCGIALTAWRLDKVHVSVYTTVTREVLSAVIGEATGRDVAAEPFAAVRATTVGGEILDAADGDHATAGDADGPVLSVPLSVRGTVVGYAFAALPSAGRFVAADQRGVESATAHIACALDRAAEWELLRADHAKTIAALAAALDSAERVDRGHTDRIAEYAIALGRELGLPSDELRSLHFAAVVHDIGTVGVDARLLDKAGPLTAEERAEVQRHVHVGADIIGQLQFLEDVTPVVRHHHERWDGSGYPAGLDGERIPMLARLLAVVDAFDAMTSPRPYRPQLTLAEARAELARGAGTQFDPGAVQAFVAVLDRQALAGMTGLLATRHAGDGRHLPA